MRAIKKQYKHGLKFDSKLELFFYDLLRKEKIPFEFQVSYELHPAFKYDKKSVRPMTLIVDFDFTEHGINAIVDTKGYQRQDNKLKWKWFKYINREVEPKIFFPRSQKECQEVIKILKKLVN